MARIVYDGEALNQLLRSPNGAVARDLMVRANRVQNVAKQLCPVDQGRLRSSISKEIRKENNELVARVGTNVEYAFFVHEGVGLYGPNKKMIVPVRAKALRWANVNNSGRGRRRYKGGATAQYVYSKKSRGFRGTKYLTKALPAGRQSSTQA